MKLFTNVATVIAAYTAGLTVRITFLLLKWTGKIKIVNPENFPKLKPGTLIVSNHPDLLDCMYEIFLLPALLFPQFALHPLKFAPWFTLDKSNFMDKWYWFWLTPRAIPVQRGKSGRIREARKIVSVLREYNGVMIHFPEGGRTCTGKKFQLSGSGEKSIRALNPSVGWLVLKTQASVVPIWLENGHVPQQFEKKLFSWPNFKRGPIIIKFGKPIELNGELKANSPIGLTYLIAKDLLELADQE